MDKAIYNHIKKLLRDYPKLDKYIEQAVASQSVLTIADNRYIYNLKASKEIISDCLETCDEITLQIISELYFKPYPTATITSLSMKLHLSRSQVARRRIALFKELQRKLGW